MIEDPHKQWLRMMIKKSKTEGYNNYEQILQDASFLKLKILQSLCLPRFNIQARALGPYQEL